MQIHKTIQKYRKEKRLTQEEMADRLGVTAPAVNKWENGKSMPDITMLAPIARLLEISLDTLLSYTPELTDEEINAFVKQADEKFMKEPYEEVFLWIKAKQEMYPNCEKLILFLTIQAECQYCIQKIEKEEYERFFEENYKRILNSNDEMLRKTAANSLYAFYMRKEDYKKAEECISYFSIENPERKRKLAYLYSKTERIEEAYKNYEEILFSELQMIAMTLVSIYHLRMNENDYEKAYALAEKQKQLAHIFEYGDYTECAPFLEYYTAQRNAEKTAETMEKLLESIPTMSAYRNSFLYEHMKFKEVSAEFLENLKEKLLEEFSDSETFDFLQGNERYERLIGGK